MNPVAIRSDRRFRRSHVKPSRRRSRWRPFVRAAVTWSLLASGALYALYRSGDAILHLGVFDIDHIVVSGNERLSAEATEEALHGMRGENILSSDLAAWRRQLMASPWVRDAILRRSLPSTVRVRVSERAPVALGRLDGELYLIDETGSTIDRYGPDYSDLDVPIVDGLTPGGGQPTDPARAQLATRLLAEIASRPELAERLSQVDVSDVRNATVILTGDEAVIYLGSDRFVERLSTYLELAATLKEQVHEIDYVDVRFDDRLYVGPVGMGR